MIDFRFLFMVAVAIGCSILGSTAGFQKSPVSKIERIYVEPFVTRSGAVQFRQDVIAELRKLPSVSLERDAANADAVLGGGGEIWIKGYLQHNPRLGQAAPDGSPVYTGYLAVELKDPNGQTLWSYLATPPTISGDITKELSILIVKKLVGALEHGETLPRMTHSSQPQTTLRGAGATFPYPVYAKWITNYRLENPSVEITFDPIGSEAGARRLLAKDADFGATDSADVIRELSPKDEKKYLFFPSVVGAVVPVVNLPGLAGDIAFTPEALAAIYLGKVKKWNDPILTRSNRSVHLPDLDVVVVHRADGSGTSYAWTDYLSKTRPEWKRQVGTSLAPKWPIGLGATGNDGVAKLVKERVGAIGYVEFIYALQNQLRYGPVQNRRGEFISANLESIAAAASHAGKVANDFKISLVDTSGSGAYPISSFTWLIVPDNYINQAKRDAMTGFLQWILGPGQRQAAALGYVALPKQLLSKEMDVITKIR